MRIDFSVPECSTCYHYRTSGILNTQESEPSNVIGSSVSSIPVSSGPVQSLEHVSADVGSTSTSSPVHSSSTSPSVPPVITSVNSEPAQPLGSTVFNDGALAAAFESAQAPVQVAFGSGAYATSTSSTSSPLHSSSPIRFGFAPTLGPTTFGSMQAPAFGSGALFAAPTPSTFGSIQASGAFAAPKPSTLGPMLAPTFGSGASATSASSTSSRVHGSSPTRFGFAPAVTSVSSAPTQALGSTAFGFDAFSGPTPPRFGSMQAPVQASASSTSTSFSFGPAQDFGKTASASASLSGNGVYFARPDVGFLPAINTPTTTVVFGTTPVSVSSLYGPTQDFAKTSSVCAASNTTPKNPFNSFFPGFGVGYLPGSSSNPFGPNPSTTMPVSDVGSLSAGVKTSSPQVFGFSGATALFPSSSSSSPAATFSSNPNIVSQLSASHECNSRTEQGSRYPRYEPHYDFGENRNMMISISASNSYGLKSHEELRWEDYKQGDKGGLLPAAHISPMGSKPNAVFSTSTTSPSSFASRSIPEHPQMTTFGTTQGNMTGSAFGFVPTAGGTTSSSTRFGQTNEAFTGFGNLFPSYSSTSPTTFFAAPTSSSVQRPHETAAVSSAASGCTACGATSFNVATTPPSAATSLPAAQATTPAPQASYPMMYGTTPAPQSYPMMYGTTPAPQSYPMMYGTTPAPQSYPTMYGSTPASQAYPTMYGSTPAPQAYPTMYGSTPAPQAYPTMYGSTPASQAYPTMFGSTPAAQACPTMFGSTRASQAYPTMFGSTPAPQACPMMYGSTRAPQAYPMMFGSSPAPQAYPLMFGSTPAPQAYPIHGYIILPFAAMNLQ